MDWLVVGFVALQAIALALVAAQAIARGRALDEIDEQLGAQPGDAAVRAAAGPGSREDAVVAAAGRVRRRLEAAELALQRQAADLQQLLDGLTIGVLRFGDELRVEMANAAAHHYLARDPGGLVGRTAIEALADHRFEAAVRAASETGHGTAELALRPPAGPTLLVRARRSPVRGVWVVIEDVAELRRLQRIRAEFVDNLSHELRTPITTIGLLAETLERDAEVAGSAVPARMRERVTKLQVETGVIAQMVEELLDLARIESGAAPLHLDEVDVARVAVESVDRLHLFAERQGIRLRAIVPGAPVRVRGDAVRLGQVLANLIHNAVKFSPAGSEVTVAVTPGADGCEVAVEDHGIGIAPADLPRIFERFYKADRARARGGGTGLGLAIARHIVEGHGGRIRVQSREGEGSTFTISLPTTPSPQREIEG